MQDILSIPHRCSAEKGRVLLRYVCILADPSFIDGRVCRDVPMTVVLLLQDVVWMICTTNVAV